MLKKGSSLQDVLNKIGMYFEGSKSDYTKLKTYALYDGKVQDNGHRLSPTILKQNDDGTLVEIKPAFKTFTLLHYWAKDGEVVLEFEDDKLLKIRTREKLGRH